MSRLKYIKTFFLRMIVALFFLLGCLIFYYVGKIAYKETFKKRARIDYVQNRMSAEIKRINSVIESVQKIPMDLADILEIQETKDVDLEILLRSILLNNKELYGVAVSYEPYQYSKDSLYHDVYLYRSGDSTIFDNIAAPSYNYFNMAWYSVPKKLLRPIWTNPYFENSGDRVFMSTFSVPFFRFSGTKEKFCGIICVDVSIETLSNRVEAIGKKLNGNVIILAENGLVIASQNKDWINKKTVVTLSSEKNSPVLLEIYQDMQKGISGVKKMVEFENLKDVYAFYKIFPTNKWGFILFLPKEELNKY